MSDDAPAPAPDPMALMNTSRAAVDITEQDRERAVLHALLTGSTRAGAELVGVEPRRVRRWIKAFPFNAEVAERIQALRARSTSEAWAAETIAIAVLHRGLARYANLEAQGTPASLKDLETLAATAQRVAGILALLGELELHVRITHPTSDAELDGMKDGELLALAARLETERDARGIEQGDDDAVDVEGELRQDPAAETGS